MAAAARRVALAAMLLAALLVAATRIGGAQFLDLSEDPEMTPPDESSPEDCIACHGEGAQTLKFPHEPAQTDHCIACHHYEEGVPHGQLLDSTRELCLSC